MNKKNLIVIIPVGYTTNINFLLDTIASIQYYCGKSHKIILTNDTQSSLPIDKKKLDIDIVDMPERMGKQSGLYFSLCAGFRHAIENYDFNVILRMDDDALITGSLPEKEAIHYFNTYPEVGILGSYRVDWKGEPRSFSPPKKQILIELSPVWRIFNSFRNRKTNSILPIYLKARKNNYELGEHVLGGVYFMSKKMAHLLYEHKLMPATNFLGSKLEEDHIFGMLTHAVGMKLGDFVTGDYPMCLKWKGMPTSPKQILEMDKKVIHSTRYFEDMDEDRVREKFRSVRK